MTDRSELRQDPVTGKWVVIATARAKRPHDFARVRAARLALPASLETCPFCNTARFPQAKETLFLPRGNRWQIRAFPNKFPAFVPDHAARARKIGPYTVLDAVGFHEVIAPRAHDAFWATMDRALGALYLRAWLDRYQALMVQPAVAYIQLIENHGPESGGSVEHPHVQLFASPVLPNEEVLILLQGAEAYFSQNGSCAFCDLLEYERAEKARVVFENSRFTVLCPFASRAPGEQWILPNGHSPGFEALRAEDLPDLAEALQEALGRLWRGFRDPAYNLYVYSAPCDTTGYICEADEFAHFHWHVQILPRMNVWGGFELATGMEIHSLLPEEAAAFLREHRGE